jgi:short-subunit dehydrogenase
MSNDSEVANTPHCAVVIGVGGRAGIGGAVAHRFAREGLHVYVVGRTAVKLNEVVAAINADGGSATAIINELRDEDEIAALFTRINAEGRTLAAVIYNAAYLNMPRRFLGTPPDFVEGNWRLTCLAGIIAGQMAARQMLAQGHGTLIVTGATASLRGKPLFAAFASAKAALRAFVLTLAQEVAPQGIHVAHVVIDGAVAGDRAKTALFGLGRAALLVKGEEGTLEPDTVAESYWQLHAQARGAWTQELDLRPFKEKF